MGWPAAPWYELLAIERAYERPINPDNIPMRLLAGSPGGANYERYWRKGRHDRKAKIAALNAQGLTYRGNRFEVGKSPYGARKAKPT